MTANRWAVGTEATTVSGRAPPVRLLPIATPIRALPKSKASQVTGLAVGISGVTNRPGEIEGIHA